MAAIAEEFLTTMAGAELEFRIKCHLTPREYRFILKNFGDDIKRIQQTSNDLQNLAEGKLIVAKILATEQENISHDTFEFIHSEIIACIAKSQSQKVDTPIFHSMSNNYKHITVVCDNLYAFKFLQKSVEEICEARTKVGPIFVKPLLLNANEVYCFGAIYYTIIEPEAFITQVKVHRPNLNAEHWILVSYKIFPNKSETRFIFLVNEASALALTYIHRNKLFLSLINAAFFNKGQLPLEDEDD